MSDYDYDWITHKKEDNNDNTAECSVSVAAMVAQTANQFIYEKMLPAGFEYYEECGAYYNQQSGYYYDPNSCLFFHPLTNCYYRFNQETNEYETFKADNEMKIPHWTKKGFKKRAKNICGLQFVQNASQEDIEIMELALDLVDRCSFLAGDYSNRRLAKRALVESRMFEEEIDGIIIKRTNINQMDMMDQNLSTSSDEENLNEILRLEDERRMAEEKMASEAPCIRLIVQPENKLHIVTILGARVGFSSKMDIQLENASAELGENDQASPIFIINYINEGNYENTANCLGRRNGRYQLEMPSCIKIPVYLNGKQLTPAENHQIDHEDALQIGNIQNGNSMKFHIHSGLNTCAGCEPGLFVNKCSDNSHQNKLRKFSKNAERRKQTRALKEHYGLLKKNDSMQDIRSNYVDRAEESRKNIGSIGPNKIKNQAGGIYAGCLAAPIPGCSVDSVQLMANNSNSTNEKISKGIEEENKGFQLLKGMGWKKGQGLGKDNQGIQEPISTALKNDRAGLGVEQNQKMPKISIRMKDERQQILEKTKKRYEQILKKQNE